VTITCNVFIQCLQIFTNVLFIVVKFFKNILMYFIFTSTSVYIYGLSKQKYTVVQ